jgi:hypothetical protein
MGRGVIGRHVQRRAVGVVKAEVFDNAGLKSAGAIQSGDHGEGGDALSFH